MSAAEEQSPCCRCDTPGLACFNVNMAIQNLMLLPFLCFMVGWNVHSGHAWTSVSALASVCSITSILWGYAYCCCSFRTPESTGCFKSAAKFSVLHTIALLLAMIVMGATVEEATEFQCSMEVFCGADNTANMNSYHKMAVCAADHSETGLPFETKARLCVAPSHESQGADRKHGSHQGGTAPAVGGGPPLVTHFMLTGCDNHGGRDSTCWAFNSKAECANEPVNLVDDGANECHKMSLTDFNRIVYFVQMGIMLFMVLGTLGFSFAGAGQRPEDGFSRGRVHSAPPTASRVAAAIPTVAATPIDACAVPADAQSGMPVAVQLD